MEAIISLVLSSLIVMLISTVFVVQTDFYETQMQRSAAQDNARVITEVIASAVRTTMGPAILIAEEDRMVIRSPLALVTICAVQADRHHVHFEGGEAGLDSIAFAGVGVLNDTTGVWSYYASTWKNIDNTSGDSHTRCAANGTDTVGIMDEFNKLRRINTLHGSIPPVGTLMVFYEETEFLIDDSTLEPGVLGLFTGGYGEDLTEFASGLDTTAGFLYRTGGTTYASSVTGVYLDSIDAVRLVAATRVRAPSGGRDDIVAGWSVNVPLRNNR